MLRQIIVVFWALCAWPVLGQTQVFLVGNEGVDAPECGWTGHKCRSISQAIRNARDGDTVFVEVGIYGDLNKNGVIGEPGEESGGASCSCVIHVNKSVAVLSERGAAMTIIDARDVTTGTRVVQLDAPKASFGYAGQGFTVLAARTHAGISTGSSYGAIKVWGNRVSGATYGIIGQDVHVYDNEITASDVGILILDGLVVRNVVTANTADGIFAGPIGLDARIEDNVVAGNGGAGLRLGGNIGTASFVTGNDIVHNGGPGIALEGSLPGRQRTVVIQDNNIFGNGHASSAASGCGIDNPTGSYVWAANNYWGTLGVANRACNGPGSITVVEPRRAEPDSRAGN
jgi:hypothetical protein